ncbi:MAG: RNA methyltransferase [Verrucomicrobia bacterium]|nr:MAG: RNA methyltransferase [Verrucomicrobiota bacterium]
MPVTKADTTRLRDLREKKAREAAGLFVVEGPKVVSELLAAGAPLVELYATSAWSPPPASAALEPRMIFVTEAEMARISHYPTPSPVLAVGTFRRAHLAPGELAKGLTLALDGIQDPGNVGTLLRLADWFGFARVLLSPDSADLFSQKVINASMGSFARVRVVTTELAPVLAEYAVGAGSRPPVSPAPLPVLGCDLNGDSVYELEPLRDAVVIIGSEGRGPSSAVRATVTRWITIPRCGEAESLNAAVAAGIVCAVLRRP